MRPEECRERMREIRYSLAKHAGHKVLLMIRDGRKRVPKVATLARSSGGKIDARFEDYAKDGSLRCVRSISIDPVQIFSGDIAVDYYDDGI